VVPPPTTALGALLRYIADPERKRFQPMNVNFGLIPALSARLRGKAKKEMMAQRALADMDAWLRETHGVGIRIGACATPLSAPAVAR
jgi:methylenetetrahydrofolate--tRNA-(uracil-5-)-methyltransferase